ncbi:MAG: glycosyltransferase family 4 protein [Candidatus Methanoperedens sp.]|nr:glycosyltransferase family 4 protein [Candidatus Methanoperedens sp.]
MKILICTPEYPPKASGIGIVAKSVVDEFIKKGHECVICSPTGPDIKLGNQKYIKKFAGFGLIYFWEQVRRYFNKETNNYDAIWLHHPFFIFKNPFLKSLITMHTTYAGFYMQSRCSNHHWWIRIYYYFMNLFERYSLTKCLDNNVKFTSICDTVVKELKYYGIKNMIEIISNGTNTGTFIIQQDKNIIRTELEIPDNRIVFIWVGRLIEEKRPDILLHLFLQFGDLSEKFYLIVVGDGKLREKLENLAEKYQLKNIRFFGAIEYSLMSKIIGCGDYYIMTSSYEGQPLTLLEAMSSGLPCIVSDIPNLDIIEDANCGIIIDFSDIEKAAQKIIKYVYQDNSKHAQNARKYSEENLNWELIAEKYLYELNNLKMND